MYLDKSIILSGAGKVRMQYISSDIHINTTKNNVNFCRIDFIWNLAEFTLFIHQLLVHGMKLDSLNINDNALY